jgi:hypothetical protein
MKTRQQLAVDLRYVLLSLRVGAVDPDTAADILEALIEAKALSDQVDAARERRERAEYFRGLEAEYPDSRRLRETRRKAERLAAEGFDPIPVDTEELVELLD